MTEQQHLRILALIHDLWKIVAPVGSLHPYWNMIFDMQAFTKNEGTIVQHTAEEWIAYAEKLLAANNRRINMINVLVRAIHSTEKNPLGEIRGRVFGLNDIDCIREYATSLISDDLMALEIKIISENKSDLCLNPVTASLNELRGFPVQRPV